MMLLPRANGAWHTEAIVDAADKMHNRGWHSLAVQNVLAIDCREAFEDA